MEDKVQDLRRELVVLPVEEKGALATELVRSLDPELKREVVAEFIVTTPEERAARQESMNTALQRLLVTVVSAGIIVFAVLILYYTVQTSPENVEVVAGVITTLTGTAIGYVGGRASASQQPTDNNTG